MLNPEISRDPIRPALVTTDLLGPGEGGDDGSSSFGSSGMKTGLQRIISPFYNDGSATVRK